MSFRITSNADQTAALGPAELVLFHRRKLHRLLEINEAMAELTLATAQRDAIDTVPNPTTKPTAALERIGRCMRRTMLLDRMLNDPVRTRRAPSPNHGDRVVDATPATLPPKPDRTDRERIDRERPERLDRPDFLIDLTKTTPAEVIAEIQHDLGMTDLANLHAVDALYARMVQTKKTKPFPSPRGLSEDEAIDQGGGEGISARRPGGERRGHAGPDLPPTPHPQAHRYWTSPRSTHGPPR